MSVIASAAPVVKPVMQPSFRNFSRKLGSHHVGRPI